MSDSSLGGRTAPPKRVEPLTNATTLRKRGFTTLTLDADPAAEAFYLAHGGARIGTSSSSSIAGRTVPRLRIDTSRSAVEAAGRPGITILPRPARSCRDQR